VSADAIEARPAADGLVRRVAEIWALLGGVVLLGIALMSTWSVIGAFVFDRAVQGDVELTEMFVAVAVFMFLPYCQLTDANVTADIFTARASARTVNLLQLLAAFVAVGFCLLLLWRMYEGLLDYRQYVETTTILHIPIWFAYVPILISLVLLVMACLVSVRDLLRQGRSAH